MELLIASVIGFVAKIIPWVLGALAVFWAGGKWQNKNNELKRTLELNKAIDLAQKRQEKAGIIREKVEKRSADLTNLSDDELLNRGNKLFTDLHSPTDDKD